MKAAAIDVGTNTVKLVVGERNINGLKLLTEAVLQPRIGEGVDEAGFICSDAINRAIMDISKFLSIAREHGAENVRVVGTSAMRDARNSAEVVEQMRGELGIDLEILSEEDECRISYMAIALDPVLGEYEETQVVADVGGGSSELTFGKGAHIIGGKSVRIGAVRLTERHITTDLPSKDDLKNAAEAAKSLLKEAVLTQQAGRVVGVGGSAVNIARMLKRILVGTIKGAHGAVITRDALRGLIDKLAQMTIAERRSVIGLDPERADIILGGAIILESIMTLTGAPEMVTSARGLRHGVLYEMLSV